MKIVVDGKLNKFYLAYEEWRPVYGHEIKVGKYRFCAAPLARGINVSEVTTGMKLIDIPFSENVLNQTATYEQTMIFFGKIGNFLETEINRSSDFDAVLRSQKNKTFKKLGDMPEQ